MKKIALTQKVFVDKDNSERMDAIDQNWLDLFHKCNFTVELISNFPRFINKEFLKSIDGVIFSGGNSLLSCNGNSPERDATEKKLFLLANQMNIPILGFCRGMQLIQEIDGAILRRVEGHVMKKQKIWINNKEVEVNSYHNFGTKNKTENYETWAESTDGVIKAIKHKKKKICGIMWHPERFKPFRNDDIKFIKNFFYD